MNTEKKARFLTTNSLVNRFLIASLIMLPLFIVISGAMLLNAFQHSQTKAEEEKLQAQLYLLLSVTELEKHRPQLPEILTEPRFNQQQSGLYAFIYNNTGKELWRSPSALLLPNKLFNNNQDFQLDQRIFQLGNKHQGKHQLNYLSHDIEWISENGAIQPLRFIVASDAALLMAEISSYQQHLWKSLGVMGLLLILSQLLIMLWGLQPLKRLHQQLQQLQQQKIQQLDTNYPIEIQPVINNFNTIFFQEKQQRERYRHTMTDLAHSLKTPLAVVQSQLAESPEKNHILSEQIKRINQIISHQLRRAVIRTDHNTLDHHNHKIHVYQLVERLIQTLKKVYQQRQVTMTNLCHSDCLFYGDEADLLEVLGNLLDNACKYGNNAVVINASHQQNTLTISISDNGEGIDTRLYSTILQRGERADTAQAGQGIGLSVVADIVSSYGGKIYVGNNATPPHLCGACFSVVFYQ